MTWPASPAEPQREEAVDAGSLGAQPIRVVALREHEPAVAPGLTRSPFCTYKKGPTLMHASASAADRLHDWLTLGRIVIDHILRCPGARMFVDFLK